MKAPNDAFGAFFVPCICCTVFVLYFLSSVLPEMTQLPSHKDIIF